MTGNGARWSGRVFLVFVVVVVVVCYADGNGSAGCLGVLR